MGKKQIIMLVAYVVSMTGIMAATIIYDRKMSKAHNEYLNQKKELDEKMAKAYYGIKED